MDDQQRDDQRKLLTVLILVGAFPLLLYIVTVIDRHLYGIDRYPYYYGPVDEVEDASQGSHAEEGDAQNLEDLERRVEKLEAR